MSNDELKRLARDVASLNTMTPEEFVEMAAEGLMRFRAATEDFLEAAEWAWRRMQSERNE